MATTRKKPVKRSLARKPATKAKASRDAQEAKAKGAQAATLKKLAPIARQANAALSKADTAQGRADDLRLTAAQHLEQARTMCEKAKVNFKEWCEKNIEKSYDECKRLARIGGADDPAAALQDLRAQNARRNKKARDKAKAAKGTTSRRTVNEGSASRVQPANPFVSTLDAAQSLSEQEQANLIGEIAGPIGFAMVTKDDAAKLRAHEDDIGTLDQARAAANALTAANRRKLLTWLTDVVENEAQAAIERQKAAQSPDALDIPPALDKRRKSSKRGARRPKAKA